MSHANSSGAIGSERNGVGGRAHRSLPEALNNGVVVGIDPGLDRHGVIALVAGTNYCLHSTHTPNTVVGMKLLVERLTGLRRQHGRLQIAMEEASSYGEGLAHYLEHHGFSVETISALAVARYREIFRIDANDLSDAETAARLLASQPQLAREAPHAIARRDPHGDSHQRLRQLSRRHQRWTDQHTMTINELHATLRMAWLAEYQAFFSRIDGKSALAFWQACPTPVEAAAADVNTLAQMLRAASHGRFTEAKAREKAASITRTARELSEAFATRASEQWSGWAEDIRMLSRHLSQINAYLAELTEQMEGVIEKIQSPLRGLKGLGTLSIAIIHGETGAIARFATADRFARYNGTAPREVSSGRSRQHCKNSQCNQHLRRILLQFALNAPRYHEESAAYQDRLRQRGITDGAARIRLARRWSDILYAILRHNRPYDVAIFRRDQAGKRPAA